jgi:hypothetical protein
LQEIYLEIAIIGVLVFLVIIEAFLIRKARKRIFELEKALGPEGLLSIDEAKLPSRMHKEILASLEWLRSLRYRIPTMDNLMLEALKDELTDTHEMYCEVFGKDLIEKMTDNPGLQLKQALLLHIEITIGLVEREIAAKSSKGLLSIGEAKLPSRINKEILVSLEWLRSLRYQIPTMDNLMLEALRDELTDTHEMYCEAFGKDLIEKVTDNSGSQLRQARLLHIEIAIGLVEREITAKSS